VQGERVGRREGGSVPCSPEREEVWGEHGWCRSCPACSVPGDRSGEKNKGGRWFLAYESPAVQRPRSSGEAWNGKRSMRGS
jgi:hypothetical protein